LSPDKRAYRHQLQNGRQVGHYIPYCSPFAVREQWARFVTEALAFTGLRRTHADQLTPNDQSTTHCIGLLGQERQRVLRTPEASLLRSNDAARRRLIFSVRL
jgi:hypothetical protein